MRFGIFLCSLLLFLCSCASSERMMRITGDASAYSIPKADRLKGMTSLPRLPEKIRSRQLGGEINLWPFFFRHRDYWNALWPMIDCDAYGFAVRPFYVQEGREKSILFPLSAWNNESGWVLNSYWSKKSFGAVPLFHRGKDFSYYGPFWRKEKAWGVFPLLHWGNGLKYVFPSISYIDNVNWHFTYILPCFFFSKYICNIVGPFWWYDSGMELRWGVAPVWFWKNPQTHFLIPLYYKDRKEFYSLLYSYKEKGDEKILSVLGPLYWRSVTPKSRYTLAGGLLYWGSENKFKLSETLDHVNEKNFLQNLFLIDLVCRKQNLPAVKTYAEFVSLKKSLAQKLSKEYYGLFPFFHKSTSQDKEEFDILKILYRQEKVDNLMTAPRWAQKRKFSVSLPLLLTFYEKKHHKEDFFSLLLMYGAYKNYAPCVTDELMPFLYTGSRRQSAFEGTFYRLWCNEQLKKYGITLPEGLKNSSQICFYLDCLKYYGKLPKTLEHAGSGFFPLWHYSTGKEGYSFWLNCLLSGWGRDKEGYFRYSVPLLSWDYENRKEMTSGQGVLFPIYKSFSKSRKEVNIVEKEHLRRAAFESAFEYTQRNWGLLLAIQKEGTFYTPRQKGQAARLNALLAKLKAYKKASRTYLADAKIYSDRKRLIRRAAAATGFVLPDLDNAEALEASREGLLKNLGKFERSQEKAKRRLEKLDFQLFSGLAAWGIVWQKDADKAEKELLEKHTEKADVAQTRSLFYRSDRGKGFHQWRFMWFLLHGAKAPEKEHFSVLEFLYRYRREGKRTSLLCFPFITVNKDEKSSEWSFLYRLFRFRNEGNKRSGYIFFIPFGQK